MRRIPGLRPYTGQSAVVILVFISTLVHGQDFTSSSDFDESEKPFPAPLYSSRDYFSDPVEEVVEPPPSLAPKPAFRPFLKINNTATWLAGGGADGLGIAEVSLGGTTILPLTVFGSPLMLMPSFGVSVIDAPQGIDLPSELYRVSAGIMWMKQTSEKVNVMVGVTPGVSSDFKATDTAFRMFGYGAVTWQKSPELQFTFGAAYTGRNDIPVFPMAGMTWTPNEDLRIEFAAPRPRIARRIQCLPWSHSEADDWVYFAGELGGGTWAIQQPTGADDQLTLRDFRLVLGYERKARRGLQGKVEVGYVFGREIEFEDAPQKFEPSNTILVRTGFSF